jgi:hypothetical protein
MSAKPVTKSFVPAADDWMCRHFGSFVICRQSQAKKKLPSRQLGARTKALSQHA